MAFHEKLWIQLLLKAMSIPEMQRIVFAEIIPAYPALKSSPPSLLPRFQPPVQHPECISSPASNRIPLIVNVSAS